MANSTPIDIHTYMCSDLGLFLPAINEFTWSIGVRATLYMFGLIWLFFAVAIVADTFMRGVEKITSKTRMIKIYDPDTKKNQEIEVKVWNDTVANLTLLAFGTSAPEILLSVIEIIGGNFKAGPLGPGTIVGSAAFNLLVITPICIFSIPNGEIRRIKSMGVFVLTTCSSVFAYVWLALVLVAFSPGIVEVWEAVITFLLFPGLIISGYFVDKRCEKQDNKDAEIGLELDSVTDDKKGLAPSGRADIIEVAKELERDPSLSVDEAAQVVTAKMASKQQHSQLWYRVNATRVITGGSKLIPQVNDTLKDMYESIQLPEGPARLAPSELDALSDFGKKSVVEFTAASCAVLENEGSVRIGIRRFGNTSHTITVSIETIDGSAESGQDYVPFSGTVTFKPKEQLKEIFIKIIDDDVWEPDEFFFVKLFLTEDQDDLVGLGKISINQVTIVNDDEPGKFEFSKPSYVVKESTDFALLSVNRVNGADGEATVSWTTKDLTARNGVEYLGGEGKLVFKHGETSKVLSLQINRITSLQEPNFQVELSTPSGGAEIGKKCKAIVTIITDEEFNNIVSRIENKTKNNLEGLKLDTGSWTEQFYDAFNVNGGDRANSSLIDYVMHFITFFWKVLFAFIPPPAIGGGWFTLIISLAFIAFFTAIISDLASIFGCLIELSPTITALTFVALGTSMPDTFASKLAAINEKYADASIGNINGSNSVNVFLGLGMPWLIASAYWQSQGLYFEVPSGDLVFSVIMYTGCSFIALAVLLLRRNMKFFGEGELGGPYGPKIFSALLIFSSWVVYVVLSSLNAQKIIHVQI